MGKDGVMTPKAIANRIKAKGLQRLRWYCQMCQKQCRDENGFKCHLTSEGHLRQMQIFGENPDKFVDEFSQEFEKEFLEHMKTCHRTTRVQANYVYNEYIKDRHHVHMNSTKWLTLTDFVKHLGRTGKCFVEETPKGWFIKLTPAVADPRLLASENEKLKRKRLDEADEIRHERELRAQIERANASQQAQPPERIEATELERKAGEKITLGINRSAKPTLKANPLGASILSSEEEEQESPGDVPNDNKRRPENNGVHTEDPATSSRKQQKASQWICPRIVVKVLSKNLKELGYYKKKGRILKVIDTYVAEIEMLDSGDVVRVDQQELETVIPQVGGKVLIVKGEMVGHRAELRGLETDKYKAKVCVLHGESAGRELLLEYEDISKLA